MYYIFKTNIDLKKETGLTGNFKINIPFLDVIIECKNELTELKINKIKEKISTLMENKFNIKNMDVEIKNIIK